MQHQLATQRLNKYHRDRQDHHEFHFFRDKRYATYKNNTQVNKMEKLSIIGLVGKFDTQIAPTGDFYKSIQQHRGNGT